MLPALENQPELPGHLEFFWDAFWNLHSDRPASMGGPSPIPFSSIDRYADRFGIADVDEFQRVLHLVRSMDASYVKWASEKAKRERRGKS